MPAETIQGLPQLRRRLKALADGGEHRKMMQTVGLLAVRYGKQEVPRKTSNLGRTIRLGNIEDTSVQVIAGGTRQVGYARYVEFGTRPHIIRARKAKALRWAPAAADRRATGTPRTGAVRAGRVRFAKVVHHPGTQATHFLEKAATKAAKDADLAGMIVSVWNRAAIVVLMVVGWDVLSRG